MNFVRPDPYWFFFAGRNRIFLYCQIRICNPAGKFLAQFGIRILKIMKTFVAINMLRKIYYLITNTAPNVIRNLEAPLRVIINL